MSCINCCNLRTKVFEPSDLVKMDGFRFGRKVDFPLSVKRRLAKNQFVRAVWCKEDIIDKVYVFDRKLDVYLINYRIRRTNNENCEYFVDMEGA